MPDSETVKVKGEKNGLCNRTACQSPNNVIFFNRGTNAYYCPRCARLINEHNPTRDGQELCIRED